MRLSILKCYKLNVSCEKNSAANSCKLKSSKHFEFVLFFFIVVSLRESTSFCREFKIFGEIPKTTLIKCTCAIYNIQ
jgi:hypothetical protein